MSTLSSSPISSDSLQIYQDLDYLKKICNEPEVIVTYPNQSDEYFEYTVDPDTLGRIMFSANP